MSVKNKISIAACVIAGLLFVISGIGKMLNVSDFAQIIAGYGFPSLKFVAPALVVLEIALGLCLIFFYRIRIAAAVSLLMIVALTVVFTYALVVNGIENCGCFGEIKFLNLSPTGTYIRNTVLCALLLWIFLFPFEKTVSKSKFIWKPYLIVLLLLGVSFCAGYTSVKNNKLTAKTNLYNTKELIGTRADKTVLSEFVDFSTDSVVMLSIFSYGCPHCWNMIANANYYRQSTYIDRVVVLVLGDSAMQKYLDHYYQPNFELINVPDDKRKQIAQIVTKLPTTFYIKNDTILNIFEGQIPSIFHLERPTFENEIHKKK